MKKKLILPLFLLAVSMFVSCEEGATLNSSIGTAYINIGEEVIEVEVSSWRNHDDNLIRIFTIDGTVYLCDTDDVVLIERQ